MNSKFSMSITSEAESLSLSRYRAPSDTSSMQQFEMDAMTYPQKMEFKKLNAGGIQGNTNNTTPNPFGQQAQTNDLHTMFVRQDYQPTTLSAVFTICGLAAGIGIGVLLSKLEASADVVSWVALPGELYLDALICVVVPGVFCSVVVAVAEVVANSTVRKVAMYSALWFTIAALLASAVGTVFAAIFSSSFEPHGRGKSTDVLPQFAFKCASNTYLTMANNGTVLCGAANETATTLFTVKETDAFFELSSTEYATVTLTSQVVGILSNMIPSNILDGFVDDTYVSVIFTAFFFAVACTFGHDSRRGVPNYLILIVSQAGIVFRMIINVLLKLLPVAVISLVGGSIGNNKSSIDVLNDVVYLVLGMVAAAAVFIFVVLGLALFVMTKRNVLTFVAHMLPAQAFVLGCSSTMATLPMTIRCVDNSNEVPRSVSRIVLPFAATCNLTGMSLYIPLAVVFLAKISGLGEELTAGKYVLLWLLGAIASFGASTVEHSEMVMVITIWRAILNRDPGDLFATLVVTDWLLQRLRTLVNVTSHAILARIVAEHCHDPDLFKDPGAFLVDSLAATPESQRQNDF